MDKELIWIINWNANTVIQVRCIAESEDYVTYLGMFHHVYDIKRELAFEFDTEEEAKAFLNKHSRTFNLPEAEANIIQEIKDRQEKGQEKYGTTTDRTDLKIGDWLQHAKEEAMDLSIYLERLLIDFKELEHWVENFEGLKEEHLSEEFELGELRKFYNQFKNMLV